MNRTTLLRRVAQIAVGVISVAVSACGGSSQSDCAATATCGSVSSANDAGGAESAVSTDGSLSADTGAGADVMNASGVCAVDTDCELGAICAGHACVPGCNAAHGCKGADSCCSGKCVDEKTDVENCGTCAMPCTVANGKPSCVGGACAVASCTDGFVDCDGKVDNGCELAKPAGPSVPSPTRPVAGDYTGSFRADAAANTLRPTFKWTPSTPDTCGAVTYQIQLDDSCTPGTIQSCAFASPEVDTTVTASSFQPATPLAVRNTQPVGTRYYWRVRACDVAKVCSSWSTVRYVEVGRLRDDLNGDGYSDLLVRGGADNLYIYFGGSPPSAQAAVHGTPGSFFAFAGDLDGDGFVDLVVADPTTVKGGGSFGAILVYLGKSTWGTELGAHESIYHSADSSMGFPNEVSAAGDLDGDGHADIMASLASQATVSVYLNVAGHYDAPQYFNILGDDALESDGFGRAGDMDGDGLTEIAVLYNPVNAKALQFFHGAPTPTADLFASLTPRTADMRIMRPAGDLDGDGFDDVALSGLSNLQSALVTIHGASNFKGAGGIQDTRRFADDSVAFRGLAAGWDTNHDGFSDIYWTAVEGYALLSIPGIAHFSEQSPATTVDASSTGSVYGTALAMGDYDGDGAADLAVASTLWHPTGNPTATGTVSIRLAKNTVIPLTAPSMVGFGAALGH